MPESVTFSGLTMDPETVTVYSQNWSPFQQARSWNVTPIIYITASGLVTATLSDGGGSATIDCIRLSDPPEVTSFEFVNHSNGTKYPDGIGSWEGQTVDPQEAFKLNDIIKVSGTCDTHATSIQFTSSDSSLSATQTFTVTGGTFSGDLTAGPKSYDTGGYFTMKCLQTGYADGPSITSYNQDGFFLMNNYPATYSSPILDYEDNYARLQKSESCTVHCQVYTYYLSPLYKYTCEEGTDVAVQGGDTTYNTTKTWDHNLAYEKWWDTTSGVAGGNNAKLKVYNQTNGLESEVDFTIELDIDIEFDFTYNIDGYPGSQACLGDSNLFQCKGDHGASTNVQEVRFASQSNSNSVHLNSSSAVTLTSGS
jgi:hypothetical protein